MTNPSVPALEQLGHPPLVEVAAGLLFKPLPGLDPVSTGVFWSQVRERYPHRELRHALEERPVLFRTGTPPMRTWLVSATGDQLLQIQQDRFVLNWRAVGRSYPRFSSPDGVRDRTLEEFQGLRTFAHDLFSQVPMLTHAEVLKIDMLQEGVHWTDASDLWAMIPALGRAMASAPFHGSPRVTWGVVDECADGVTRMSVDMVEVPGAPRAVRLETVSRVVTDGDGAKAALDKANLRVNNVFAWLIPRAERDTRFQGE